MDGLYETEIMKPKQELYKEAITMAKALSAFTGNADCQNQFCVGILITRKAFDELCYRT